MIILDTHVISEPLKPRPDTAVLRWLDRQSAETLYVTTISQAELLAGVAALPAGKRRTELKNIVEKELAVLFANRAGNPIDFADAAVGAIAMENNFMLATRNVGDFKGTPVKLLNPWS